MRWGIVRRFRGLEFTGRLSAEAKLQFLVESYLPTRQGSFQSTLRSEPDTRLIGTEADKQHTSFCTASETFKLEQVMQTHCVRQGQTEIGIIEHEGHEFSALGATVQGRSITGYTKSLGKQIHLTSWYGKTTLASRCEIVERFWSGTLALMFRLPRGRFIVGYSLGDGMLFRGELLTNCDEDDARRHALMVSECFAQLDAEDEEAFDAESSEFSL